MLTTLSINNIVLIDKLNFDIEKGLCVLTGETGSGKSILLDALGLAVGYRSSSRLLRKGKKQGSIIAEFNIKDNSECKNILTINDLETSNNLILRRVLYEDGRSKAFINDTPISQNLLNQIGETLLEVHGQNEQRGLLNPSIHRKILDEYGKLEGQTNMVSASYEEMKKFEKQLNELLTKKDSLEKEQDYLQFVISEIETINPQLNEEEELAEKRTSLRNKEKVINVLENVYNELEQQNNISKNIANAQGLLSRNIDHNKNFSKIISLLEKSSIELSEALSLINETYNSFMLDNNNLEQIEERLFTIKGLARKFKIQTNELPEYLQKLKQELSNIQNQEILFSELQENLKIAKQNYIKQSQQLRKQRIETAKELSKNIIQELKPLKMEKTIFEVSITELDEQHYTKHGTENIKFKASTNPGTPLDDLTKIASGGELSRFMLALKVVLSKTKTIPTIIFDEIDSGIGGAVANAVGERLKQLGQQAQVLVVTHSPQIASKGNYHIKITKTQKQDTTETHIDILNTKTKIQELARMLSGEQITQEAIKAAEKLMEK